MFTLGVSDHVMIAHSFADPFFGPAQRMHGATYSIDLEVRSPCLGPHHVVMDIGALRTLLRRALEAIDYSNLDDNPAFPGRTSTTERVAEHLGEVLSARLRDLPASSGPPSGSHLRVVVRESPVAYVAFDRAI
jgi:6-pyruvoyltetrahydropterin/6-carboxytetrahydropterin synthase